MASTTLEDVPADVRGVAEQFEHWRAAKQGSERAVRQGMAREKIDDLPLFPEGRPTATPTCPRILEAFDSVSWHEFRRGEEIVRFPIELTALQKLLLKLLEVPRELYA